MAEPIRFITPIRTDASSEITSPRSLTNAKLNRENISVEATKTAEDNANLATPMPVPQGKPYYHWNGRLISNDPAGDKVLVAGKYNSVLYAIDESVGVVSYPANYDNRRFDREEEVPHITKIELKSILSNGTAAQSEGKIVYIMVPFNDRGEAGPGAWWGYVFTYEDAGDVIRKNEQQILVSTSPSVAYLEVYRTRDSLKDEDTPSQAPANEAQANTLNLQELLYLGRFSKDLENSQVLTVLDDKYWHPEGDYHLKNASGTSSNMKMSELESAAASGKVSYARIAIPSKLYNRSLRAVGQPIKTGMTEGLFDCTTASSKFTSEFGTPTKLLARAMHNDAGVMLYGDVEWATRYPMIGAWDVIANPNAGLGDAQFQYEYTTSEGDVFGPVLEVRNASRALVIWQGENALRMYRPYQLAVTESDVAGSKIHVAGDQTSDFYIGQSIEVVGNTSGNNGTYSVTSFSYNGPADETFVVVSPAPSTSSDPDDGYIRIAWNLAQRFVPDELGRYRAQYPTAVGSRVAPATWTFDTRTASVYTADIADDRQQNVRMVAERNVVLMSAQNRPQEVTFDQIIVPDKAPVVAITPARLSEEEGVRAYEFYIFTEESIYAVTIDHVGRVGTLYPVTSETGMKRARDVAIKNWLHLGTYAEGDYVVHYEPVASPADLRHVKSSGYTTAVSLGKVVDSAATFVTEGVEFRDIVLNTSTGDVGTVALEDIETECYVQPDIFPNTLDNYVIGTAQKVLYRAKAAIAMAPADAEPGIGAAWQTYFERPLRLTNGIYATVRDGVAFAGTDGNLYLLSGRALRQIDLQVPGLWSEVYDLTYHRKDEDLYVATDTGIWIFNLDYYSGFYKHISYPTSNPEPVGGDSYLIQYIEGDIADSSILPPYLYDTESNPLQDTEGSLLVDTTPYGGSGNAIEDLSHVILHKPVSGDLFILEYLAGQASDASLTTQPIRVNNRLKLREVSADFDLGPKSAFYQITASSSTVTLVEPFGGSYPNNFGFSSSDVGLQILLAGAGAGASALLTEITGFTSATEVTVADAASTTVTSADEKAAVWPVVDITLNTEGRKPGVQTFQAYPMARRFPKMAGREHKLTVDRFKELFSVFIELGDS